MPQQALVPDAALARLRTICLDLPETVEEKAWVGTRWCVRKKNFAHVLMISNGWPPAYVRASGLTGTGSPVCALTFRLAVLALEAPRMQRPPFFKPVWWPNIGGMVIDARTDWDEVESLLIESWLALAPKKLAATLDRPG